MKRITIKKNNEEWAYMTTLNGHELWLLKGTNHFIKIPITFINQIYEKNQKMGNKNA